MDIFLERTWTRRRWSGKKSRQFMKTLILATFGGSIQRKERIDMRSTFIVAALSIKRRPPSEPVLNAQGNRALVGSVNTGHHFKSALALLYITLCNFVTLNTVMQYLTCCVNLISLLGKFYFTRRYNLDVLSRIVRLSAVSGIKCRFFHCWIT